MKISVIIPVYNKSKYLKTLLQQVREQSFTDFECLLIDDGSTDGSEKICDEFAALDQRYKVFHIPNGGVSNARNVGLDQAQGEYVTFIDADDGLHSDFLKNLLQCAAESDVQFVIGNLKMVWENKNDSIVLQIPYQGKCTIESILPDFARIQRYIGIYGFCVAKLIRRDIIGDVRFNPNIRLAEDLDFYLEIYPKLHSVYFDTKPYYYYLQAAENSSMLDEDSKIDYYTQLRIQLKIVKFLRQMEHFYGENESVMLARLYDYVFFCIFHSELKKVRKTSMNIKNLGLPLRQKEKDILIKRLLLFFFDINMHRINVILLVLYRMARSYLPKPNRG